LTDNDKALAEKIAKQCHYDLGAVVWHYFPDGELHIKISTEVKNREIILVSSLDKPNNKIIALLFFSKTVRDLGAIKIQLITPYLAYMRQDKRFNPGEGITSHYFAELLSTYFDRLITVDPHLHRYKALSEVYTIPAVVVHANKKIGEWIKENIKKPLLVGPDVESEQWVAEAAKIVAAPYVIINKIRYGDKEVKIEVPDVEQYKMHTPVLVDDIISTACTMIEAVKVLKSRNTNSPVCVGVHAVFAEDAYQNLLNAKPAKVITCNTIQHPSNAVDISDILVKELQ